MKITLPLVFLAILVFQESTFANALEKAPKIVCQYDAVSKDIPRVYTPQRNKASDWEETEESFEQNWEGENGETYRVHINRFSGQSFFRVAVEKEGRLVSARVGMGFCKKGSYQDRQF